MFLHRHFSGFCVDAVFERRMDVALWSGRGAAACEPVHTDCIQSKVSTPKGGPGTPCFEQKQIDVENQSTGNKHTGTGT